MHLACPGVGRKLLMIWMNGPLSTRFSKAQLQQVTDILLSLRKYFPAEFSGKPIALKDICHWKATEYRLFLLYIGSILLQNIVSQGIYDHFMLFHVALTILVDFCLCYTHLDFADRLLRRFVKNFTLLYPSNPITYNLHSLIHLIDDVRKYGPLDKFSCFPFENYFDHLKKWIRSAKNSLAQAAHCLGEDFHLNDSQQDYSYISKLKSSPKTFASWNLPSYRKVVCKNMIVSIDKPDNCRLCKDSIALVQHLFQAKKASFCCPEIDGNRRLSL